VVPGLTKEFAEAEAWQALVQKIEAAGHLTAAADLTAARIAFYPFSTATAEFALRVREQSGGNATLKVFECPMVSKAVPGAGKTGRWLQLEGPIHNPYYGAEMLDCGSEVKP
jgi:Cu(I)/Ag(I) efflux system membrane fusion protein